MQAEYMVISVSKEVKKNSSLVSLLKSRWRRKKEVGVFFENLSFYKIRLDSEVMKYKIQSM